MNPLTCSDSEDETSQEEMNPMGLVRVGSPTFDVLVTNDAEQNSTIQSPIAADQAQAEAGERGVVAERAAAAKKEKATAVEKAAVAERAHAKLNDEKNKLEAKLKKHRQAKDGDVWADLTSQG